MIKTIKIKRSAKINLGNYENTDVGIELEADVTNSSVEEVTKQLFASADAILKEKIDEIELGKRKIASKAGRFGV